MNSGLTKWLVGALAYTAIAFALVPAFSDHWDYPELTLSTLAPTSSPSPVANPATDNPTQDSATANAGPTAEAAGASTDPAITQEEPAASPRRLVVNVQAYRPWRP